MEGQSPGIVECWAVRRSSGRGCSPSGPGTCPEIAREKVMRISGFIALAALLVTFGCGGGGGAPPGSVNLNPRSVTLTLTDTQAFNASVVGSPGVGINWTVTEGAAGGTVTSGGFYTAPNAAGVFHVVAT